MANKVVHFSNGTDNIYAIDVPYSTNEIRVGTWFDGKPLYRKVIQFPAHSNSVQHNVSNLQYVFIECGFIFVDNGSSRPLDVSKSYTSDGVINLSFDSEGWRDYSGIVIIKYTKTIN